MGKAEGRVWLGVGGIPVSCRAHVLTPFLSVLGFSSTEVTICILGSPTSYLSVLLEGGSQCPGGCWVSVLGPCASPPLPVCWGQYSPFSGPILMKGHEVQHPILPSSQNWLGCSHLKTEPGCPWWGSLCHQALGLDSLKAAGLTQMGTRSELFY